MGAIETWRCVACSKEEVVHVNSSVSIGNFPLNNEPVFRLLVEWAAMPAAKDVESLRSLFPRVKELTVATMMRAAREKKAIDFGRYTDSELLPKIEILKTLNIKLSLMPINVS